MAARVFTHEEILPVIRGVVLCIFLAALDQTIIVPAVPRMAHDLGGSIGLVQPNITVTIQNAAERRDGGGDVAGARIRGGFGACAMVAVVAVAIAAVMKNGVLRS